MADIWSTISNYFGTFDFWQVLSATFFLIAIVDPIGNMPVTINMEQKGLKVKPMLVVGVSAIILLCFLFLGQLMLKIFGIRIEYFACAGGFIIFLMALEMILDMVFFKADVEDKNGGNIVPLAFPMYAGPGAFTALLSMTGDYGMINLAAAVLVCMVILWAVLVGTHWLMNHMGKNALYVCRKFFGVIVLGIAVQLMFGNLMKVLAEIL